MGWWVTDLLHNAPVLLVAQIFWVIVSICLHELAHGWAAIRFGDDTPIVSGHMTWNPLVHMGPMSLLAFALVGIAWGAMPVNPNRLRGRHAEALVALAGPAMNLAIAIFCMVVGGILANHGQAIAVGTSSNSLAFCLWGAYLNLLLMAFNLVPIPPLDGSRILAHYVQPYRDLINNPQFQGAAMIGFLLLFVWGGKFLMGPALEGAVRGTALVSRIIPG